MAQLKSDPIGLADLQSYLQSSSDFGFELKVLRLVRELGWECEHGGVYEDPVTRKTREFDIRAIARHGNYVVRLAVECKNIKEYFPLLVSGTPRSDAECYRQMLEIRAPKVADPIYLATASRAVVRRAKNVAAGDFMGRSLAQVGRVKASGDLFSQDAEVFEKWSQCLGSSAALIQRIYNEPFPEKGAVMGMIVPIVVVPAGRLWLAEYDRDAEPKRGPHQSDHCSFLVNKSYKTDLNGPNFIVSTLEICTIDGLANALRGAARDEPSLIEFIARGFGTA